MEIISVLEDWVDKKDILDDEILLLASSALKWVSGKLLSPGILHSGNFITYEAPRKKIQP